MSRKIKQYSAFLALTTALISGTANFANKFAVTALKDPVLFTTLKNSLVAIFLLGVLVALKKRREIFSLTRNQIVKLIAIGVIGGSIPFALFFTGLSRTTALNAALIHKTLFLWVLMLAIPILKERIATWQWIGVAAIFSANILGVGFSGFKYNSGELMILGATILWAIENIIAKTTLKDLSSSVVAAARMVVGSFLLILLILWQGGSGAVLTLNASQWGWTVFTALLLSGYVLTWYEALKYAPATFVAALLVPATLVTNFLTAVFVTKTLAPVPLLNTSLFVIGTALIIFFTKTAESKTEPTSPILKPVITQ